MKIHLSQMFKDDRTDQLSLGRVSATLILIWLIACSGHLIATGKGLVDLPTNWMVTMLTFYGINKGGSAAITIAEVKANVGIKKEN